MPRPTSASNYQTWSRTQQEETARRLLEQAAQVTDSSIPLSSAVPSMASHQPIIPNYTLPHLPHHRPPSRPVVPAPPVQVPQPPPPAPVTPLPMAATASSMPAHGHATAPKFNIDQLHKLRHYFEELDLLFATCNIIDDQVKKTQAKQYLNINSSEL